MDTEQEWKWKELGFRAQAEQLVLEESGDIVYICTDRELEYVITDAGRLLELAMEIGSTSDCTYLFQETCSKSII